jgi:signal transduction histidine kinase
MFLASAALVVAAVLAAVWFVNRTVTAQVEREIARGLAEAGTLVDEYRRVSLAQIAQAASLVADLPKLKAAVALDDPPTLAPLASDYHRRLGVDVLLVVGKSGHLLAWEGQRGLEVDLPTLVAVRTAGPASAGESSGPQFIPAPGSDPVGGRAQVTFVAAPGGIIQLVTVPIWIDPSAPDVLGTLSVGTALDRTFAAQIKRLTDSDVAFAWHGRVVASTVPDTWLAPLEALLRTGRDGRVQVGGEQHDAIVRGLAAPTSAATGADLQRGALVVMRSRTERLRPLRALHGALAIIAVLAVLSATLLSYFVARTVTRPVRAIAATMRNVAVSGDVSRPPLVSGTRWDDEDARVLGATFNAMTEAIARFQREAAQRDRLSSLGRLSTVIAHEVRNPLMIIKASLRTLRRTDPSGSQAAAALTDIDDEVRRLDGIVADVLDFARPIRFAWARASLSELVRDAVAASGAATAPLTCRLELSAEADPLVTDSRRLSQALVNVLANARQALEAGHRDVSDAPARNGRAPADIEVVTAVDGTDRVRITVRDRGPGIEAAALPRVFDPFFTTKATGTGIGLAITRNIVEGLGGRIRAASEPGGGTEMTIELPRRAPAGQDTRS